MRGDSDGSRGTKRASLLLTFSVASLPLDHRMPNRGEVIRVDTQITHKSGLANNLWVQMAALVIVTIVVIALAAKFIWKGPVDAAKAQATLAQCKGEGVTGAGPTDPGTVLGPLAQARKETTLVDACTARNSYIHAQQ